MTETSTTQGIEIVHEDNKVNIIMDMSMFDLFSLCAARYDMRHNKLKAPPIYEKSKSLDLGSMAHEGFEVYFRMLKEQAHYNDRMHAAIQRIEMFASDPLQSNAETEDVSLIINAFTQSCDYWRFEDEQMEILEVEQAFAYVLYEDADVRIIVSGKIDLLVNIPAIGRNSSYTNLPIDHKTYQRDFEVPRLSNQFLNYCNAVESNYLIVNRVGLQKTLKPEEKFKRVPLSYDPLIIADWKTNVTNTILEDYLTCIRTGHWKMRFTSCWAWNRRCEYHDICETSGQEAKLFKLENRFATVNPWDVTAKLGKG